MHKKSNFIFAHVVATRRAMASTPVMALLAHLTPPGVRTRSGIKMKPPGYTPRRTHGDSVDEPRGRDDVSSSAAGSTHRGKEMVAIVLWFILLAWLAHVAPSSSGPGERPRSSSSAAPDNAESMVATPSDEASCVAAVSSERFVNTSHFERRRPTDIAKIFHEISALKTSVDALYAHVDTERERNAQRMAELSANVTAQWGALPSQGEVLRSAQTAAEDRVRALARGFVRVDDAPSVLQPSIQTAVNNALNALQHDGTGRADVAAITAGGSVDAHDTSPTYKTASRLEWFFFAAGPEVALRANDACWRCAADDCTLTVRLRAPVRISAVSIEHFSRFVEEPFTGPRGFQVSAMSADARKPTDSRNDFVHVVSGEYAKDGAVIQTFEAENLVVSSRVRLQVISTHSNLPWVCIKRFRVHGP